MNEAASKNEYQDRYIAFLDILGSKELILQSESDPKIIELLADSIGEASAILRSRQHLMNAGEPDIDMQITNFSDTIVISTRKKGLGLCAIREAIDVIFYKYMSFGRMLRGGLTQGKLYHRDSVIFGPALVHAYAMESKLAIYPRIIMDEDIAVQSNGFHQIPGSSNLMPAVRRSQDKLAHINPATNYSLDINSEVKEYLIALAKSTKNDAYRSKINWAIEEWNKNLELLDLESIEPNEVEFTGIDLFQELEDLKSNFRTGKR